jgi:hypothetical protein
MPYIDKEQRQMVDDCINDVVMCIKTTLLDKDNINSFKTDHISNQDMIKICGVLNYIITRVCAKIITEVSYSKIAIITGVLENVKQEFYRRMASPYEDKKINQNGDVSEYEMPM